MTETFNSSPARQAIRTDFPNSVSLKYIHIERQAELIATTLRKELDKQDTINAQEIYIAYPHKHPVLFAEHPNPMNKQQAGILEKALKKQLPEIEFHIADTLVETRHLNRSENQDCLHSLTGKQNYTFLESAPFFKKEDQTPNLFFLIDDFIDQGTSMANLMNFIDCNGGKTILMGACNAAQITQKRNDPIAISNTQNTSLSQKILTYRERNHKNSGRLPELSASFLLSAENAGQKSATERSCMKEFRDAMRHIDHSPFALTEGESTKIIHDIYKRELSFSALISHLKAQI